jgi:hypothetical protein
MIRYVILNPRCRIDTKDPVQWIIQTCGLKQKWNAKRYCRTKQALIRDLIYCGATPDAIRMAGIHDWPEWKEPHVQAFIDRQVSDSTSGTATQLGEKRIGDKLREGLE